MLIFRVTGVMGIKKSPSEKEDFFPFFLGGGGGGVSLDKQNSEGELQCLEWNFQVTETGQNTVPAPHSICSSTILSTLPQLLHRSHGN